MQMLENVTTREIPLPSPNPMSATRVPGLKPIFFDGEQNLYRFYHMSYEASLEQFIKISKARISNRLSQAVRYVLSLRIS